jgi:hypothetical protein
VRFNVTLFEDCSALRDFQATDSPCRNLRFKIMAWSCYECITRPHKEFEMKLGVYEEGATSKKKLAVRQNLLANLSCSYYNCHKGSVHLKVI